MSGIFSDSRKYLLLYKAVKEHTQDTDSLERRKQAIIACNLRSIDEEDIERFCNDWKGATSLTVTNKNLYTILMGILHPKEQINHKPSSLQKTLNTTSIPQTSITTTSATNLTHPPSLSKQP